MYNDSQGNNMEQNSKSFLGIFLNQARLNAYIALCHISDLMEENTVDEDSLTQMPVLKFLESNKDVLKSERTFNLVEKHFPMLKVIYDSEPKNEQEGNFLERTKKYRKILICLLKALNYNRNENCHAYSGKGKPDDVGELIKYLDNCFDASVRRIKDIRSLDEKDVLHLRRKISEGEGEDKRVVDNPNFHYHFDEKGQLNEKGLAFLTSIFLEKRDTYLFLKRQRGFKRGETPAEKATLECFCCYRMKLPKPVMTSDVDKNGLALDMLNELKKCPKELFELLSKDRQEDFRKTDSSDTEEDGNENLMRRYLDRFPYLALRYCDENELFQNLRFHIDLGRYYFKFYEKPTIDGGTYQRALDKRLKTFGRIRDVKEKVEQQWKDIIKSPGDNTEEQSEPYKTNTTPHYNLVDNQIGFVISGDCDLPDIKQPEGKITLQKPDAWLSIYELPGMIFHGLTFGFKKTESLIKQYIERQRKICKKICETGAIPEDAGEFLPESLKDTGTSDAGQNNYAGEKLQRMLEDTKHRITAIKTTSQRMDDKSNKPGKKKFFDIRAGKLADFLARDIMALQKFDPVKNGKDKLTSIDYQVLQASLAFFSAKKDTIADIFKRIGLLDGDNPHPFLNQINLAGYNSIADFYLAYLNTKQQYLEGCKKDGDLDDCQFLRPSRQRYAKGKRDLKTIAKQLLDNPVNIPKGFFQKQINEVVCKQDPSLNNRPMNTAYMIQAWFEITHGGCQPFYGYEKTYPIVSKAAEYGKKAVNRNIARELRSITAQMSYKEMKFFIEEKIPDKGRYDPENLRENLLKGCSDFKDNERLLRRSRVQDMVMFMMFETTLKEHLSIDGNVVKLQDITLLEDSPFNKPVRCDTIITVPFNTKPEHYDNGYVVFIQEKYKGFCISQPNRIILKYKVTSENTKLKDLGKYRRYLYDRRLPGLLIWKYPPNAQSDTEIKYSYIEEQIKAYEQHRVEIAGLLYGLENKVIDCLMPKDALGDDYIDFNRIIDTIKDKLTGVDEKAETLRKIRNGVYHNQFPAFSDAIEKADGGSIAEKMLSITQRYVEQIIEQIN
jgi:hypothetical protein